LPYLRGYMTWVAEGRRLRAKHVAIRPDAEVVHACVTRALCTESMNRMTRLSIGRSFTFA